MKNAVNIHNRKTIYFEVIVKFSVKKFSFLFKCKKNLLKMNIYSFIKSILICIIFFSLCKTPVIKLWGQINISLMFGSITFSIFNPFHREWSISELQQNQKCAIRFISSTPINSLSHSDHFQRQTHFAILIWRICLWFRSVWVNFSLDAFFFLHWVAWSRILKNKNAALWVWRDQWTRR